jgi:hypothetical protein
MHRHRGHSAFERFSSASGTSSISFLRIIGSMFMRVNSTCAHQVRPPLADLDGCRSPAAPTVVALIKKRNTPENGRHDVAKRAEPLFSRSEAPLPAESRQLGSLESRRTSS